jgi:hypothetical protein
MRVGYIKKAGVGLLVVGMLSAFAGFLGVGYAGADASWDPADNANINPGNVLPDGASNPGYQSEDDCGTSAAGDWGWYFVLPKGTANGATEFVSIDVQFENAGLIQHAEFIHPNDTLNKAVVYTATSDTLVDARAVVSPTPDPSPAQFVLSHVCAGTTESSSSESSSSESSSSESSSSESSSSESSSSESSSSESSSSESSSVESSSSESSSVDSSSSSVLSSEQSTVSEAETPAAVLGAEAARAALPRTGFDPSGLFTVGMVTAMSGGALTALGSGLGRRKKA